MAKGGGSPGRPQRDASLLLQIKAIYDEHKGRYGSPRIHQQLARQGLLVGRERVERLIRKHGLYGRIRRRFVRTTSVDPNATPAPNLLARDFKATAPNLKWATDITYIDSDEGWLYLAVIQDLFSGRVVGWAARDTLHIDLCLEALEMAIAARNPPAGLIHQSDRGCQYTSQEYRRALNERRIICSMRRSTRLKNLSHDLSGFSGDHQASVHGPLQVVFPGQFKAIC